MAADPIVDVNLFVHDSATMVAAAIESVLAQTWPAIRLTLIDDGSTDATAEVLAGYAARDSRIRLMRNRGNGGAIANFQRAFWYGDGDFVLPKSGDDLIAPEFVERAMAILLSEPDCAMCHAAGLIFYDDYRPGEAYPPAHRLDIGDADPLTRARAVMARYTSAPAFWGIYRREAASRLAPIAYRAGWDHVVLAELALYGTIRHVPELLYWRRDGGKPIDRLARAATLAATRGVGLGDALAEQRWRTPLITTAFAHIENFATARLPFADRLALIDSVPGIFRARWLPALRREAQLLADALPALFASLAAAPPLLRCVLGGEIAAALRAARAIVPESGLALAALELAAITGEEMPHVAA
ncbi:MAG: glycosyltransferase family 2 protein [Rhodospirillales bacterium]|nr:glycosyltransferase family 2 protein [Rhodospirillales bacterium]